MKKRTIHPFHVFIMLSTFLLLFVFTATHAFAEFYVIAGSRGVGKEIKSLPYTISSSGFYYITKDLSCAAGSYGITIYANNVTLDLMGFSLVGPGGSESYDGIYMQEDTNVEIRNGTVRNFARYGILENSSLGTGHRIINIRAKDNGSSGIYLFGTNNLVERCTAAGNGDAGIAVGLGSTITGNTCYMNTKEGLGAGSGSTITGNTCYSNGNDGIYASAGSTVTGNTCYLNGDDGIAASTGTSVIGNTCYNNTGTGIILEGGNLVVQNTATGNAINMNDPGTCTFDANHTTTLPAP